VKALPAVGPPTVARRASHAVRRVENATARELKALLQDPHVAAHPGLLAAVAERALCLSTGAAAGAAAKQRSLRTPYVQKALVKWTELEWKVPSFEAVVARRLESINFDIPGSKRTW
jgi:hypothetical protein